jgi:hypothetical protein
MSQTNTKKQFQNFEVDIKIKLAALWASVTFCYLYGDYFELYIPQKTASLVSGDTLLNSPEKLFFAAFLLAIPAIMVFLSVLLNPKINRMLNLITGAFFTLIMILIGITSFESWKAFYVFYAFLESIITIIIVWTALKWPLQSENTILK